MQQETLLFQQLLAAFSQAERILLVADGKPDGDSLGSSSALLNWLLPQGKQVTAFCAASVPQAYFYLDNIQRFRCDAAAFDTAYDLIVTCDASDLRHCGIVNLLNKTPKGYQLIAIDHHATNERFGDLNVILTQASSTAEVIYRFFAGNRLPIDAKIATSLLTGIITDTSSFSNAGTTVSSMEAAGQLVAHGARHGDIIRHLIRNKSISSLKLWGVALSRLNYNAAFNVASTYFLQQDIKRLGANDDAIEGLTNFLAGACSGADTILVLRETADGRIKGSLRSVSRDISKLAQAMGGGGHKKAAGFTLDGTFAFDGHQVKIISSVAT